MVSRGISQLVDVQGVLVELPRHQMPFRDLDLLLLGVAGDADDLHAVAQRRADRLGDVRRGDEQHLRQVVRDLEVVVAELPVLLGIEHFEQRRRRIAAEIGADLVDLVEHDHRVARARGAHRLDDPPRQCTDVRAPMPTNLGLIAYAAEAHAHELAIERSRDADRPSDVLPTPGGPTKHRIGVWNVRRFAGSECGGSCRRGDPSPLSEPGRLDVLRSWDILWLARPAIGAAPATPPASWVELTQFGRRQRPVASHSDRALCRPAAL